MEPIRNKIAHNRKASKDDLAATQNAYGVLTNSIGLERFYQLSASCTTAEDLGDRLARLLDEARGALDRCQMFEPLDSLDTWEEIYQCWWFDGDYLGTDVTCIEDYFGALLEYRALSRARGTGHLIERWVKSQGLQTKSAVAIQQLSCLVTDAGRL